MKRCWVSTKKTESGLYRQFTPYIYTSRGLGAVARAIVINAAAIVSLTQIAGGGFGGTTGGRVLHTHRRVFRSHVRDAGRCTASTTITCYADR
jgi:hypothetical protein